MTTARLALSIAADCPVYAADSPRLIEVIVTAPALPVTTDRPALNLALVLDRSGSMSGDKLHHAQAAARHVVGLLTERDRAALVAYDDQIVVAAPSAPMTPANRRHLLARLEALRPGGSTDLAGGWLAGCDQVAAHHGASGLHRAFLLTDGLANVGITEVATLASYAANLRARGITTSTFGVGLDFDEHLLTAMAEQGGGRFAYIERSDQLPAIFSQELGALLTTVGGEASLSLTLPPGATVDVLGDLPHERQVNHLRLFLGNIVAGEERAVYLRLTLPAATPGTPLTLSATLGYADTASQHQTTTAALTLTATTAAELAGAPIDTALLGRASEVEVAAAASRAGRLERDGQGQEAHKVLTDAIAAAAPYLPPTTTAAYSQEADELAAGLTTAQRKQRHAAYYERRHARKTT